MGGEYFKIRILEPFHHSRYSLYMQEQLFEPRQEHHHQLVPFLLDVSFRKNIVVNELCFRSLYVQVPV